MNHKEQKGDEILKFLSYLPVIWLLIFFSYFMISLKNRELYNQIEEFLGLEKLLFKTGIISISVLFPIFLIAFSIYGVRFLKKRKEEDKNNLNSVLIFLISLIVILGLMICFMECDIFRHTEIWYFLNSIYD